MAETTKVVFAEGEATIHLLMSPDPQDDGLGGKVYATESKVLLPGQYVGADQVPPYLLDKVKEGKAPGLKLVTKAKAAEILKKVGELRAISEQTVDVTGVVSEADAKRNAVQLAAKSSSDKDDE